MNGGTYTEVNDLSLESYRGPGAGKNECFAIRVAKAAQLRYKVIFPVLAYSFIVYEGVIMAT